MPANPRMAGGLFAADAGARARIERIAMEAVIAAEVARSQHQSGPGRATGQGQGHRGRTFKGTYFLFSPNQIIVFKTKIINLKADIQTPIIPE